MADAEPYGNSMHALSCSSMQGPKASPCASMQQPHSSHSWRRCEQGLALIISHVSYMLKLCLYSVEDASSSIASSAQAPSGAKALHLVARSIDQLKFQHVLQYSCGACNPCPTPGL